MWRRAHEAGLTPAAADASVERAGEWVRENIPDLIQGAPEVTNDEVRAQT